MKITKSKLKQIIKEELEELTRATRIKSEGYSDPRKDGYFHALDGKEPQRDDAKYMVGYKMGKEERKSRGKGVNEDKLEE